MDIDLLSKHLLIILGFLAGAALAVVITSEVQRLLKPDKAKSRKHKSIPLEWKIYPAVIPASIILALVIMLIIRGQYTPGEVPASLWLMVLPFTFGLLLMVAFILKAPLWIKIASVVTCLLTLIFTLTLVNNYYRFFPTLYSVFSADTRRILAEQNQGATEIRYNSKSKAVKETVESSLFGNDTTDKGHVISFIAPGTKSGFMPRTEFAYIPAIASHSTKIRLPVIVMLPGVPGQTYTWLNDGMKDTLDKFASTHHGITPYVFIADDTGSIANDTECVNSPRGQVETYLTVDLPNYIKSHYDVEPEGQKWAIGGLSMGGTCSVMLALKHPDIYKVFMDFSGDLGPTLGSKDYTVNTLFDGSGLAWQKSQPLYLLDHTPKKTLKEMYGFYGVGASDSRVYIDSTGALYEASKKAGLISQLELASGKHNWSVWEQLFQDALPVVSNRIGATDCSEACQ